MIHPLDDTLYKILGVSTDATQEEIKQAYRRRARKLHPDHGGTQAAMAALNEAYDILYDEDRRNAYNETGDTKAPDPLDKQATDMMVAAFLEELEKYQFHDGAVDIVDVMRKHWFSEQQRWAKMLMEVHGKMGRLENERSRIHRKGNAGDNVLLGAIDRMIGIQKEIIERNTLTLKAIERVSVLLAEYVYDVQPTYDPRSAPPKKLSFGTKTSITDIYNS